MPIYPYSFQLPPLNVQDIPNNGAPGEFLGISAGGVLDWLPVATGGGDMLKADNLSGLTDYATARTNIGLGTASTPTFANLTLTSPSLSSSAPVTISQTWNNAAVAFNALVVNAAGSSGTNSAAASNLLDLQVGGVSKIKVDKNGRLISSSGSSGGLFLSSGTDGIEVVGGALFTFASSNITAAINRSAAKGFSTTWDGAFAFGTSNTNANVFGADTILVRDAANTLALRNGALPQTFNVYGTWSSITDYRRLTISCDNTTGNATITANKGSATTGDVGTVSINGVPVGFGKTTGLSAVAIGTGALNANTSGQFNTAIGIQASQLNVTGTLNVSVGQNSNQAGTSGSQNTAVGVNCLFSNTTGSNNIGLGYRAGSYITGGSTLNAIANNSVFLGEFTKAAASGETNQIVIGHDATGIGSNSVVLGNDSITKTALKGNVGIGTTSPSSRLEVAFPTSLTGLNLVSAGSTSVSNFVTWSTPWGSLSGGIKSGPDNGWTTQIFSNQQLSLSAGGVDSSDLLISAAGNVGIGTNAPSSKLHVAGTIKPEQATMVDIASTTINLAASDAGTIINCTAATAITVNLPTPDTNAGYNVMIIQSGAGAVTIAANGNTRNSFGSAFTTAGQHAACSIVRTAASTYNLSGNLV